MLDEDDFHGLYVYLEEECDGRQMLLCDAAMDIPSSNPHAYLFNADSCMYNSNCLSFHQVLSYLDKLQPADDKVHVKK